VAIKDTIL
jgi:CRP-like cAMP-binding protein